MTKEQQRVMRRLWMLAMLQRARHDKKTTVAIPIHRQQIEETDVEPLIDALNLLLTDGGFVRDFRSRISFQFEGFEGEKRELDELESVRTFFKSASDGFPYWFWFLEKKSPVLKQLFYCLSKVKVFDELAQSNEFVARDIDMEAMTDFVIRYETAVRQLQEKFSLTEIETMEVLIETGNYFKNLNWNGSQSQNANHN